jgi:hypothetical protein
MRVLTAVLVVALLGAGNLCFGASIGGSQGDDELKQRIEKLEKELSTMKDSMAAQAAKPVAEPAKPVVEAVKPPVEAAKPATAPAAAEKPAAKAPAATEKKPVLAGLDVEIYGRLKLDAAYSSGRVDTGNFARWVKPDRGNNDDGQFDITANESRLGLNIYGPKNEDIKTGGKVELDFFGGGAENKSNLMMRHAYMSIDWPEEKFGIIAGQTWDVISPLNPETLNYSVCWWVGNIGYRRPQIRLTKSFSLNKDTTLKFEGAVARTIGRNNSGIMTADQGDTGENSGMPSFQGRASVTLPLLGYKPATIGFSGHYGQEKYDTAPSSTVAATDSKKFDSWSLNLDYLQPVTGWLTIKCEVFTGENLDAYLGGISQGVRNTGTSSAQIYDKEIGDAGGWIAAGLGPWGKWRFNVGVSVDDPKNDDLRGSGATLDVRTRNQSVFGNVIYAIDKNAEIGFELSQWRTEYLNAGGADSIRAQTSFIYKF